MENIKDYETLECPDCEKKCKPVRVLKNGTVVYQEHSCKTSDHSCFKIDVNGNIILDRGVMRNFLHKIGFCYWAVLFPWTFTLSNRRICKICGKKERMTYLWHQGKKQFYWMNDK